MFRVIPTTTTNTDHHDARYNRSRSWLLSHTGSTLSTIATSHRHVEEPKSSKDLYIDLHLHIYITAAALFRFFGFSHHVFGKRTRWNDLALVRRIIDRISNGKQQQHNSSYHTFFIGLIGMRLYSEGTSHVNPVWLIDSIDSWFPLIQVVLPVPVTSMTGPHDTVPRMHR
jgi:hypothetical protein